ncbi:MAG: malectin domain-containing carbohydrate-binding protein [Phycisphaerales bacterium]
MKAMRKGIVGACALGAMVAASSATAQTVNRGTLDRFANEGDVDLNGNFLYAVNVSPNDVDGYFINDLFFSSSVRTEGMIMSRSEGRDNWRERPEYGFGTATDNFEAVMWDMRFSSSQDVHIDLAVTRGTEYKLQLFFSDAYWTEAGRRSFDIMIENELVVDELDIIAVAGTHSGTPESGAVYTLEFVAQNNTLDIDLLRGTTLADGNALINAITLEVIPSPGPLAMLAAGGGLLMTRRRRTSRDA